ncbi:unnamed protein product [marine sediment metagenome]|uniref:Uncharacterized protein n=1 Tax=marine sediment metagenome TaxID=412755 RepID=X0VQG4_9ZZZZ
MAADYLAGATPNELGLIHGISAGTVRKFLVQTGVKLRSHSEAMILASRKSRKCQHNIYCTKCGIIKARCNPKVRSKERDGLCGYCVVEMIESSEDEVIFAPTH